MNSEQQLTHKVALLWRSISLQPPLLPSSPVELHAACEDPRLFSSTISSHFSQTKLSCESSGEPRGMWRLLSWYLAIQERSIKIPLCSVGKTTQIRKLLDIQESRIYIYDKRLVGVCLLIFTNSVNIWGLCTRHCFRFYRHSSVQNHKALPSVGFVCVPVLEHTAAPPLQGFSSHSLSYLVLTIVQKCIKGKSLETADVF